MSVFWFLTGMLTTVAVLVVILPWLRTIPGLGSLPVLPWQAPVIALLMIGATLAFYHWWGRPDLVAQLPPHSAQPVASTAASATAPNGAAGSMGSAVASLRARLEKGGGSNDDWELLAKSYEFMGQPDAAALARAHQLPPAGAESAAATMPLPLAAAAPTLTPQSLELLTKAAKERADKHYAAARKIYKQLADAKQMNADAWADYADTVGTEQGGKLAGEPESYISNALALDPNQPKALWLKASADEEAGRHTEAVTSWQRLLAVLPKNSEDAKIVQANLDQERQLAGAQAPAASPAAGGSSINGEVSIDSALLAKAVAGATLFIVAKSVDMPGPPVAVFRSRVAGWPVKFTLDDSLSMLPGRNLSNAKRVTVEARVSASGQALPAPGDLRGISGIIDTARHKPLNIVINEVVS